MEVKAVRQVGDIWADQYAELGPVPWVRHVQIFENRGAMIAADGRATAVRCAVRAWVRADKRLLRRCCGSEAGGWLTFGALAQLIVQPEAVPAVRLPGLIAAPDGSLVIWAQTTGVARDGDALGRRLAHKLLQDGGAELLDRTPHAGDRPQCSVRAATMKRGA
jgi:hypothetical protein